MSGDPLDAVLVRCGYAGRNVDFVDWKHATEVSFDPPLRQFGGRFDDPWGDKNIGEAGDPASSYRTLYLSSSRGRAIVEALQGLRPDRRTMERLARIETGADDRPPYDGKVSRRELARRTLHWIHVEARFAPICEGPLLQIVEPLVAEALEAASIRELRVDAVLGGSRSLTQAVGRAVYGLVDEYGRFDGIEWPSTFGTDVRNYVLFEGRGRWLELQPSTRLEGLVLDDALRRLDLEVDEDGEA